MMRIAVAGAGLIGRKHVEVVNRSRLARLSAVADPVPDAALIATASGAVHFDSIGQMLAQDPPDGAIIATPNQLHLEHALACIDAGIPVLVEKPIADSTSAARQLVEAGEAAGVPVLVGHHRRHNPLIQAAHQQIASGRIGSAVAGHAMCWLYKPDDYFSAVWRTRKGAGPVFINLIHDVDLFRYLLGDVARVQAINSGHTRKHEVEDTAAIILQMASGALVTMTVSDTIVAPWSWELTSAENADYPATDQSCYFIGGTNGSLDIPANRVWSQQGERSWWQPISHHRYQADAADPLDRQLENFCEVIAGKADPLVSGREGLKSLQVIEAICTAAETGRAIEVHS